MIALINKSSEGKSFSGTPIKTNARVDSLVTRLENLDDLGVEGAISGQLSDLVSNLANGSNRDTCVLHLAVLLRVLDFLPFTVIPIFRVEVEVLRLLVSGFKLAVTVGFKVNEGLLRNTLGNQLCSVDISYGLHVLDDSVHEWLRERRLIELVMTHLTVTD